jgi:hypothetical protein
LAVLISRLQQHHPLEIDQLANSVGKRAYLEPKDAPQSGTALGRHAADQDEDRRIAANIAKLPELVR